MAPITVIAMTSSGMCQDQGTHGGESKPTKNMRMPTSVYTMIVFQLIIR